MWVQANWLYRRSHSFLFLSQWITCIQNQRGIPRKGKVLRFSWRNWIQLSPLFPRSHSSEFSSTLCYFFFTIALYDNVVPSAFLPKMLYSLARRDAIVIHILSRVIQRYHTPRTCPPDRVQQRTFAWNGTVDDHNQIQMHTQTQTAKPWQRRTFRMAVWLRQYKSQIDHGRKCA